MTCKITNIKSPRLKELVEKNGQALGLKMYLEEKVFKKTVGIYKMSNFSELNRNMIWKRNKQYNKDNKTSHNVVFEPNGVNNYNITSINISFKPVDKVQQLERQIQSTDADDIYKQQELRNEQKKITGEQYEQLTMFQLSENQVNYVLKSVNILLSDKAKQIFDKGNKAGWDLNKILIELQVPKEQRELIVGLGIKDREELIVELSSKYSFAVEVNTATQKSGVNPLKNKKSITKEEYNRLSYKESINLGTNEEKFVYIKDAPNGSKYIRDYNGYWAYEIDEDLPTQYYSNLIVPGGTNYTENEISTPLITPSIKGHAQFSTDKGIGWFRSDEQILGSTKVQINDGTLVGEERGTKTKSRRILEIQSDLFQKGRNENWLTATEIGYYEHPSGELYSNEGLHQGEDMGVEPRPSQEEIERRKRESIYISPDKAQNDFLQLLNKDNNWVTFFLKSIIQDSAKKGYEKVLFPKGETAAKIEGHETIVNDIKRIDIELAKLKTESYYDLSKLEREANIRNTNELEQRKANLKSQGIEKLKPIEAFYEIKVGNILDKAFGKDNVKTITDEYGNEWREIEIKPERDLSPIMLQLEPNNSPKEINEKLNTFLTEFLSTNGFSVEYVNEIKEAFDGDVISSINFIKRLVLVSKGKIRKDTLPEETAHLVIKALGKDNPYVKRMFRVIEQTEEYAETLRTYGEAYKNDIDLIKEEAVGKVLADYIIREFETPSKTYPESFWSLVKALWNKFLSLFKKMDENALQREIDTIFGIVAKQTIEGKVEIGNIKESDEMYQLDILDLDNMEKKSEEIVSYLKKRIGLKKHRGDKLASINRDDLILSVLNDRFSHRKSLAPIAKAEKLYENIKKNPENADKLLEKSTIDERHKEAIREMLGASLDFDQEKIVSKEELDTLFKHENLIGLIKFIKYVSEEGNRLIKDIKTVNTDMPKLEAGKILRDVGNVSSALIHVLEELQKSLKNYKSNGIEQDTIPYGTELFSGMIDKLLNGYTYEVQKKGIKKRFTGLRDINEEYYKRSIPIFAGYLKQFVPDNALVVPFGKNKGRKIDLEEALKEADKDISFWHRWVNAMAESGDDILMLIDKSVKDAKYDARMRAVGYVKRMQRLWEKFGDDGEKDMSIVYERGKDGKVTGYFADERNYGDWEKALEKEGKRINKKYGLSDNGIERKRQLDFMNSVEPARHAQYSNEWKIWFENNTESLYSVKELEDLMAQMNAELEEEEYNIWVSSNILFDEYGMPIRGINELARPNENYINHKYLSLNQTQKDFIKELRTIKEELDLLLPAKHRTGKQVPMIRKDFMERLLSGKVKDIKGYMLDQIKVRESDIETSGSILTDINETPINILPAFYTKRIGHWEKDGKEVTLKEVQSGTVEGAEFIDTTGDDLSLDITGALSNFAFMAINYSSMNDMIDILELGKDLVKRRKVGEEDLQGRPKTNVLRMLGREISKKILKDGNETLAYQRLSDYIDMVVYGNYKKQGTPVLGIDSEKLIDSFSKFTAINNLALNVYAGIQNPILGNILTTVEAMSKQYISPKDLAYGDKIYFANAPERISQIGEGNPTNKLTLWQEMFDVLQEHDLFVETYDLDRKTRFGRWMQNSSLFFMNHIGEDWMQTRMSVAMANTVKLKDAEGNTINLWDAMEKVGNELKLKKGVTKENGEAFTQRDITDFIAKTNHLNQRIHGIYNKYDAMAIQKFALGRAALMFRKFIVPGINRRWGSLKYNYMLQDWTEGYYRTSVRFLGKIMKELRSKGLKSFSSNWKDMTEQEKIYVRKTLYEFTFLAATILLAGILSNMDGDDDDMWAANMAAYQMLRLRTELGFYASPIQFFKIVQSPAAAIDQLENIFNIVSLGSVWTWRREIESGRYEGMTRGERSLLKITPGVKTISDIFYPQEKSKYFSLSY